MAKLMLNMAEMQDHYFADAAMIGIVTALPGYHLCWVLNNHFDLEFARDPDQNICLQKKENQFYFPVFQYRFPNSSYRYLLYQLKSNGETLLPETRRLDYLWMVNTANPDDDARKLIPELRNIPDVQLAQLIPADQLKSIVNLLV